MRILFGLLMVSVLAVASPVPASSLNRDERVPVQILAAFDAAGAGNYPNAGLIMDARGALYGTTESGGANQCYDGGCGTAFKLTPNRGSQYTFTTIHQFGSGQDGSVPSGWLIADASGALYGTTVSGPPNEHGDTGTVFKLTPGAAGYRETILYRFQGGSDGSSPVGGLVADASGALYGATGAGGDNVCGGCGTIFKLTPSGSGYAETVVYKFRGGADGSQPNSPLTKDSRGVMYGTTQYGGACRFNVDGCGTVYEITPAGSGYAHVVLHAFAAGADGLLPDGALTLDASGGIYGGTLAGGVGSCPDPLGCGVVFKLAPSGSRYAERILYAFKGSPRGHRYGGIAGGGLVVDATGTIFGTTGVDGRRGCRRHEISCGTLFKLTPGASGYTEHILHVFAAASDGAGPQPGLLAGSDGTLYGTTLFGGDPRCGRGCGTVFKVHL